MPRIPLSIWPAIPDGIARILSAALAHRPDEPEEPEPAPPTRLVRIESNTENSAYPVMSAARDDEASLLLFMPGVITPGFVGPGHAIYEAVRAAGKSRKFLAVPSEVADGDHALGTLVEVISISPHEDGGLLMALRGVERVEVDVVSVAGELRGTYRPRPDLPSPALAEKVASTRELVEASPLPPGLKKDLTLPRSDANFANEFAWFALVGSVDDAAKAAVLRADDPAERIDLAIPAFHAKVERLLLENPLLALEQTLRDKPLTEVLRARVNRELDRLKDMGPQDSERAGVERWLRLVADLPWGQRPSQSTKSLAEVRAIFDQRLGGLDDVKDGLILLIDRGQRFDRETAGLSPEKRAEVSGKDYGAILEGPPGTGKTVAAKAYAEARGKKLIRFNLGGNYSSGELNGTSSSFRDAKVGEIIRTIAEAGPDVVLFFDEADKCTSGGWNGHPLSVVLEILDPEQNHEFKDLWLDVPFDLSEIPVILAVNDVGEIPDRFRAPLVDRLEHFRFEPYSPSQKLDLARSHLLPDAYTNAVSSPDRAQITDEALMHLIKNHMDSPGMRQLEVKLKKVFSAAETAVRKASEAGEPTPQFPITIDPAYVDDVLGDGISLNEIDLSGDPGYGLWMWVRKDSGLGGVGTASVDELTTREGGLTLTGTVKDAVRESAQAGFGWLAEPERRRVLGIDEAAFEPDYQINYGDIGTIKDGPSAGAMTTAILASKLMRLPIRSNFTMTGTIEPGGRVGKIGGLVNKLIAAHEAGVTEALVPAANVNDLKKLPEDVARDMTIIPVRRLEEAIQRAFVPAAEPQPESVERLHEIIQRAFPGRFDFSKPAVTVIAGTPAASPPAAAAGGLCAA